MSWRRALIVLASAAIGALGAGTAVAGPAAAFASSAAVQAGHFGPAQPVSGPVVLKVGGSARVEHISCYSPGNCVAGGTYQDNARHDQVFAVFEVNGTWQQATAIPGLIALNTGGRAEVTSASCGKAGDCAIGGSYRNDRGDEIPWVADSLAGTWRAAHPLITSGVSGIDSRRTS